MGGVGKKKARKINDVTQIVLVAETCNGERRHSPAIRFVQANRAANAGMRAGKFIHTDAAHAVHYVRFNEAVIGIAARIVKMRPDVERSMRPSGLGQVLDRSTDAAVALDQQHIAGLQACKQAILFC